MPSIGKTIRLLAMRSVTLADIEPCGVAANLRSNESFHVATMKGIITGLFGREFDDRRLKRREVLGQGWPIEHHPIGTRRRLVTIKKEANRPARLHRDDIRIELAPYHNANLLSTRSRTEAVCPRGEEGPKLSSHENNTGSENDELYRAHPYSYW